MSREPSLCWQGTEENGIKFFNIIHFGCSYFTFAKFNANLLHITIYCWLVLRHVSAWLNRQPAVQQVGTEILWILYSCMDNTTPHLTEGIMVGLWRDIWIRETGTGQQVAQLHERYMMMMMIRKSAYLKEKEKSTYSYDKESFSSVTFWITFTGRLLIRACVPDSNTYIYLLTPWSRFLLQKLTGSQIVKKFPSVYGIRRYIFAFTSACHLSLSWARSVQSVSLPHPTY